MGEKMVAEEIAEMAAISQRILEDPAKLQFLARRIKEVFKDPKFVEKMKMEMAKLQNDEEIYNWLLMTQGSDEPRRLAAAFQVQPVAFRGATSVMPRSNAQMVSTLRGANVAAKKGAFDPTEFAKTLPGITEPLGFFDPLGFCSGLTEKPATEGKVRFYREVELKHCRVAMLAALGYLRPARFEAGGPGRAEGDADEGAEQRPPGDDRDLGDGGAGGCDGRQALLRHPSASKACTGRHGVSRARSRSMAWRRWLLGIRIIHERGTVAMMSLPH